MNYGICLYKGISHFNFSGEQYNTLNINDLVKIVHLAHLATSMLPMLGTIPNYASNHDGKQKRKAHP